MMGDLTTYVYTPEDGYTVLENDNDWWALDIPTSIHQMNSPT